MRKWSTMASAAPISEESAAGRLSVVARRLPRVDSRSASRRMLLASSAYALDDNLGPEYGSSSGSSGSRVARLRPEAASATVRASSRTTDSFRTSSKDSVICTRRNRRRWAREGRDAGCPPVGGGPTARITRIFRAAGSAGEPRVEHRVQLGGERGVARATFRGRCFVRLDHDGVHRVEIPLALDSDHDGEPYGCHWLRVGIDPRSGLVPLPRAPRLGAWTVVSAASLGSAILPQIITAHAGRFFSGRKTKGRVPKRRTTETSPAVSPRVPRRVTVDPRPI